jgi:CubicO group peptidase (beta-lactamase class C family)
MRIFGKILKWLGLVVVILVIAALGWLYIFPPELIRVADAYAVKMVCSNAFLAKRDPQKVLADDVQAPGHPILKYVHVGPYGDDAFRASLLGIFATEYAVRRPGVGCANVADHDLDLARKSGLASEPVLAALSDFEWPLGDQVSLATHEKIKALIADPALSGPGMRGIVVVKDGRIIAEHYGEGFAADTPLLGWSMTKTVTGALVALRVADGKLSYDGDHLFPEWSDGRAAIKLSDLLAMQSGIMFNENYGDVSDVTRMLFLEPDQAAFFRSRPLEATPGTKFNYTTGTAVALTRIWMDTFADQNDARLYPRKALFDKIGMRSAVMETDSRGTFSGGSLMYATARDWARFGLLLLNRGDWNGVQVLPADYAALVSTPTAVSQGQYTGAQAWKLGPQDRKNGDFGLPEDTFWALGHDGQSIAIVPSEHLVVVRLGLTPAKLDYLPQPMIAKIIEVARMPAPVAPEPAAVE